MEHPHPLPAKDGPLPSDGRPDFLVRLGVMLPCSEQDVKQAYLAKAKVMHPDVGGDHERFLELQTDFERAVQYCKFHSGRSRWLAESIERYVEQQALVAEIAARGGRVTLEHLDWLKREIGEDFAQVLDTIGGVSFAGPRFGDAEIDFLLQRQKLLDTVHWVDLSRSAVTPEGVLRLAAFSRLRKIDLRGTPIGNRALRPLKELPNLEWLGLEGSRVNWFGRFLFSRARPDVQLG
jgi:hypothetical protein